MQAWRISPIALSAICLAGAAYFSYTDAAFIIRGCREEDYPEFVFYLFVAPTALAALLVAVRPLLSLEEFARKSLKAYMGISLMLSIMGLLVTALVLAEPGAGSC